MSYVRWSTMVNCELTNKEYIALMSEGLEAQEKWCKENKNPDAELSDWYIFWHSMGGEESEKREDQYLAMWNCSEERTPVLDYATVKTMLETDDWSPLGYEKLTQRELLIECVKQWLDNIGREFD